MKILVSLFLFLATASAHAQTVNSNVFLKDLRAIIDDARAGFPKATGDVQEDIDWFGKKYASRLSIFGKPGDAWLQWIKAQENRYSASTPEEFYFAQGFQLETPEGKFMADSAEALLDGIAANAGLKKRTPKQSKSARKESHSVAYVQANGKEVIGYSRNRKSGTVSLSVSSPYRPGDVAVANLLGCMVFAKAGWGFLYVVPVYGPTAPETSVLAAKTRKHADMSSDFGYEWYPGRSGMSIQQQFDKSYTVHLIHPYTVE